MIYSVKGEVFRKLKDSIVVENSVGIGYEIICNNKTLSQLTEGENRRIITYTHIMQDDMKLFGFLDERELNLFKMLISVNGVGCKLAQTILEVDPNIFLNAIINEDAKSLTKIKGVGLKTAQRIIIELKNTAKLNYSNTEATMPNECVNDAKYALLALGYSNSDIETILGDLDSCESTEEAIKKALVALNS